MTPESGNVLLVIPCFRESTRLPPFLDALGAALGRVSGVDVLVVDDGSGPEEQERTRALVADAGRRPGFAPDFLALPDNLGKGGCVHAAWNRATGHDWLAFADADGSCSAAEVCRLIAKARSLPPSVAAIYASRIKMLGRTVSRRLHRHIIGRVYASLVSLLLDIDVYDSQCGLKLVRSQAYDSIKESLTLPGFAFDVELLVALLDAGHQVIEEPIDWHHEPGGKVRLVRDSWRMFREILTIRRQRRRPR